MNQTARALGVASIVEDGCLAHSNISLAGSSAEVPPEHWPGAVAIELLRHPVDAAISRSLDLLGGWSQADRGRVIEYSPDQMQFRSTDQWCREGTVGPSILSQNTPVTLIGPLQGELLAGRLILVSDITRMPASMRNLREGYLRLGLRSMLTVPVCHQGRLRGAVVLSWTKPQKGWNKDVVAAMVVIAELIACARYGQQSALELEAEEDPKDRVYLRTRRGAIGVPTTTLLVLTAAGDQTTVQIADGSRVTDLRNLKWWSSVLPPGEFMRVHRSALARIDRIAELRRSKSGAWQVYLDGVPEALSVSRAALPPLRSRLGV